MDLRLNFLLCYSLENLFKTLQVLLPKMKRKLCSIYFDKTLIFTPELTVTLFNLNYFFKINQMVGL